MKVSGEELTIDDNTVGTTPGLKCLRSVLVINAATLATLLTIIFLDTFFIKSYFGCLENIDCYTLDNNFTQQSFLACPTVHQEQEIICYEFNFDFFQAFAETEGVLVVATLGVVIMTKLWIRCGESKCINNKNRVLCGLKCLFLVIVLAIMSGLLVLIHMHKLIIINVFCIIHALFLYPHARIHMHTAAETTTQITRS